MVHDVRGSPDGGEEGYERPARPGENVGLGCLTYIFTGNVGNCVMLPVWRAIGQFLEGLWEELK